MPYALVAIFDNKSTISFYLLFDTFLVSCKFQVFRQAQMSSPGVASNNSWTALTEEIFMKSLCLFITRTNASEFD